MASFYGDLNGAAIFKQIAVANGAATYDFADNRQAGGKVHNWLEKFTVAVGSVAGDLYYIAKLPKEAVILPTSHFRNDGAVVTGTLDVGDVSNPDGLIDGVSGTANTTVNFEGWTAGTYANAGKALWEVLGYATAEAAPAQIEIYATVVGATQATTNAEIWFNIQYTYD